MMRAVRGIYRGGVVELLEKPAGVAEAEVVVTFLPPTNDLGPEEADTLECGTFSAEARPLDDFEPVVPATSTRLSDLVLEDRG
jgi:hypothetical protein